MSILDAPLARLDGTPGTLRDLTGGQPALLVNVASKCGLTPQYSTLEQLQETYADRGFTVVGLPCNQFGGQEPGSSEEIAEFCSATYGVSFPMIEKVEVNGDDRHEIYQRARRDARTRRARPATCSGTSRSSSSTATARWWPASTRPWSRRTRRSSAASSRSSTEVDLSALLAEHPVVDGHNDLLWTAREETALRLGRPRRRRRPAPRPTPTCRGCAAGGVGAQFWSVYVPTRLTGDHAVSATLEQVDAAYALTARYADRLAPARTADDVEAAWADGRIASLMGAEGGHSINCSLGTLRQLHALGVQYLTLTHNANTPWADSATDRPVAGGLTAFGREVVREMNRIGMMVDLSHVSADTMRDALAVAEVPAIFSHSSARAVTDSPRNAPDDVLESLRDQGGVCMVTFVPKFVNQACADWHRGAVEAAAAEGIAEADNARFSPFYAAYRAARPEPVADLSDVVAHCEHVREVAGIDHVGPGRRLRRRRGAAHRARGRHGLPGTALRAGRPRLVRRRPRPAHLPQRAAGDAVRRGGGPGDPAAPGAEPGPDRGPRPPREVRQTTAQGIG